MLRYLSFSVRFVVRHRRAFVNCLLLGLHVFLRLKANTRSTPTTSPSRDRRQLSLKFEPDDPQV